MLIARDQSDSSDADRLSRRIEAPQAGMAQQRRRIGSLYGPGLADRSPRRGAYSTTFTIGCADSARYSESSCSRLVAVMVIVRPR